MSRLLRVAVAHACPATRARLLAELGADPRLQVSAAADASRGDGRLDDASGEDSTVDVVLAQPALAPPAGPDLILLAEPGRPEPALDAALALPADRLVDVVPLPAEPDGLARTVRAELIPVLTRLAVVRDLLGWCTPLPGPLECRAAGTAWPDSPFGVLAIGSGRGGLAALNGLLDALPPDLPVPVVVTQHLPAGYHGPLAERLMRPGVRLVDGNGGIDGMFRAVSRRYRDAVLAVLLGGFGRDGVQGATVVRAAGGTVFGQDEASTRPGLWAMPGALAVAGQVDRLVPFADLPAALAVTLTLPLPAGFGRHARDGRADLVVAGR